MVVGGGEATATAGVRRSRLLLALVALVLSVVPITPATAGGAEEPAEVVRVPFPQDDGSLTPYTFEQGYALVTLVYDTLMWRDPDGVPQPWLATTVETAPDGRRVTARLAKGVRWHDGTALTAADVAFTFRFLAERPHPRFTPQLRAVERVEAVDATTVVFTLRHPSPGFADQPLADVPVLPAHLWQSLPRDQLAPSGPPVGSGPYRLVEHREGERYRFEANDDYFRGPPAIRAVDVPIVPDVEDMVRSLELGRVDMVPLSLPRASADELATLATRVSTGPSYAGTVLMFNVRRAPFDRADVRRALSRAIDPRRVARAVPGSVAALGGYLHPDSPWAGASPADDEGGPAVEAPLPVPVPPVELLVAENDPAKLAAARQVAAALRDAGVEANVAPRPRDDLSRAVGEDGSPPDFSLAIWTAPALASYDPDYLATVFGSDDGTAVLNYSGYRSAAFDDLADRTARATTTAARKAAVAEQLDLLAADAPVIPLFFAAGRYAYRPGAYDGWVFVKGTGILDKRSFVGARPAGEPAAAGDEPAVDRQPAAARTAADGRNGWSPLGWGAALLAGASAVTVLVALVRGRR